MMNIMVAMLSHLLVYWYILVPLIVVALITKREYIRVLYHTLGRDFRGLITLFQVKYAIFRHKQANATVATLFKRRVRRHPDKVCFYFEDQKWTFQDVDRFSNQVANYFDSLGYKAGDEVSLFMEPRPEFVGLWLGLSKIGVVTALINTSLRLEPLIHCITIVNSKAIIFGSELSEAVREALPRLEAKRRLEYHCYGNFEANNNNQFQPLSDNIKRAPTKDIHFKGNFTDKLLYIYTSGTTGLPKAAIIKQHKYMLFGEGTSIFPGVRKSEIIYSALPLYHGLAGGCGVGMALINGHSLVIKRKFSPKTFWEDCAKYQCTAFMYVGEFCRYLLAQPCKPIDTQHSVHLMFGVGFRKKIWTDFTTRFGIEQVIEIYGSTEGNGQIVNFSNRAGSCGFIPQIVPKFVLDTFFPNYFIKVNEETGEPIRGKDGLCRPCKEGEVGQFVGHIDSRDCMRAFEGYLDRKASEKKVLRDVIRKGDACFASGDLMTIDDLGYVYFMDRIGDTYRWKAENVSTMEVEAVISSHLELTDVVVFGVEVPGCEGRAGMATIIDPRGELDPNNLLGHLTKMLPLYAVPVFVRIVPTIELTGTFKFNKVLLKREGYDPKLVSDPLFYLDISAKKYVRIYQNNYEDILNGQIRF